MILAIETSCDDTCAAIVTAGGEVRSNVASSQLVHDSFGGVVPEIASRHHLEVVNVVVDEALARAGTALGEVATVAVTQGPGLVGALLVGVAQACALVPGVSRSGSTIATGMFAGLSRAAAARFSFLMSMPITIAAMVIELPDLRHAADQGITRAEIAIGIIASLVVGVGAIRFLLRFLAVQRLYPFVIYRVALAAVVVAVLVR